VNRLFALAIIIASTSCASTTIDFGDAKPLDTVEPSSMSRLPFFFGGLLPQRSSFETAELCDQNKKVQRIEVLYTGMDVFLNIVSLNLYSPKTMRVWCI
jgi:hypothetical protein